MNNQIKKTMRQTLDEAAKLYADAHPTCGLAETTFKEGAMWERKNRWVDATKEQPESDIVLARVMPKDEVRVVQVVDGLDFNNGTESRKFIIEGGEMVTHWMDIPTF